MRGSSGYMPAEASGNAGSCWRVRGELFQTRHSRQFSDRFTPETGTGNYTAAGDALAAGILQRARRLPL
ncbi:hypothetical protein FHX76_003135 [Lysinibacter cavernae]|uniref:Uncharacterized protein n=1 Tax=Lysinibacter cavernae TaxID=1640652 RepID=A0A7X5R4L8_9MICO|nr:hypothetical protein [Lysinibacter cavernae]